MPNIMKYHPTLLTISLLLFISKISFAETPVYTEKNPKPWAERTYDDVYTIEGRKKAGLKGLFTKDIHIWTYTSDFAKRFRMPSRWIDDSLKGAEAIAYRVDHAKLPTCGTFGSADSCSYWRECVWEFYTKDSEPIPWYGEARFGTTKAFKSRYNLLPQRGDGGQVNKDAHTPTFRLGIESIGVGSTTDKGTGHGGLSIGEFFRGLFKGLDFISGYNCRAADDPQPTFEFYVIKHYKQQKYRNGYQWEIDQSKVTRKNAKNRLRHTIIPPKSFMQRVNAYMQSVGDDALLQGLRERIKHNANTIK